MITPYRLHGKAGEKHANTKYGREEVQGWRNRMRPPERIKLKDLAKELKIKSEYITLKFMEYDI